MRKKQIEKLLDGFSTFDDGRVITDKEVYDIIMTHSSIFDRLNPAKMVYMTLMSLDYLKADTEKAKRKNWHFFKCFTKHGTIPVKFEDL